VKIKSLLPIILLSLFIIIQIYLVFIKTYQVLDYVKYTNEIPQPLSNDERQIATLGQTFRSTGPLTRIDVMLGTYGEKLETGALQLSIYKDKNCFFLKNEIAGKVQDNRFHTFFIPRGKIPAGNYTFELRFLPGDKQERLAIWTSQKDIYPSGDLYINGKKQAGDMTFRIYYRAALWKLGNHMLAKIPFLWGSRIWMLIGFLFVVLALNFFFYYLVNKLI
jgi:hypothetical protein